MNESTPFQTRRLFLRGMTFGAAALGAPGLFSRLFAEELTLTPRQTEGPFYPDHLPLDTDNDLIIVNDGITPAVGEITHLSGRILDSRGDPIRNVLVEIWQVDNNGVYLHTRSNNHAGRDKNFQGFGRSLKMKGREKWTTQCYVKGEPENERDGVFRGIKDPKARESVIVDFAPIKGSRIGELAARFDIVLGFTPEA